MSESLITKKAIATALKSLILEKSFDKISIADLTKAFWSYGALTRHP